MAQLSGDPELPADSLDIQEHKNEPEINGKENSMELSTEMEVQRLYVLNCMIDFLSRQMTKIDGEIKLKENSNLSCFCDLMIKSFSKSPSEEEIICYSFLKSLGKEESSLSNSIVALKQIGNKLSQSGVSFPIDSFTQLKEYTEKIRHIDENFFAEEDGFKGYTSKRNADTKARQDINDFKKQIQKFKLLLSVSKTFALEAIKNRKIVESTEQKTDMPNKFIDQYEKDYREALRAIDEEVGELVTDGKEMKSILLFNEKLKDILDIHESLHIFYESIYNKQDMLTHFNSERIRQVGFELKATSQMLANSELPQEVVEEHVVNELKKVGFNKTHWFIKESILSEIEYMIETLRILIEPEFIPLETADDRDDSQKTNTDRYVPSSIKLAVWRRDQGRCVECASKEKLEYDHIIPVSKGGSNTERNVQLLCEKCNRQKSANIG